MNELKTIQKWLTAIIVKPGNLHEKIKLADEHYRINSTELINSSLDLSAAQKIEIYTKGYSLRLIECMVAEYPALHSLMGENVFHTFTKAYLTQLPPSSYDLYNLGKHFPEFLAASQPKENHAAAFNFDLPVDLAQLERAIAETSRSKGTEGIRQKSLPENQLFYLMETANIQASPCLKLLQLRFPLVTFTKAALHHQEAILPEKEDSHVALSRKNYRVYFSEIEAWQWHFLQALAHTKQYALAIEQTAAAHQLNKSDLMADLMLWLPIAMNNGYLYLKDHP